MGDEGGHHDYESQEAVAEDTELYHEEQEAGYEEQSFPAEEEQSYENGHQEQTVEEHFEESGKLS